MTTEMLTFHGGISAGCKDSERTYCGILCYNEHYNELEHYEEHYSEHYYELGCKKTGDCVT